MGEHAPLRLFSPTSDNFYCRINYLIYWSLIRFHIFQACYFVSRASDPIFFCILYLLLSHRLHDILDMTETQLINGKLEKSHQNIYGSLMKRFNVANPELFDKFSQLTEVSTVKQIYQHCLTSFLAQR